MSEPEKVEKPSPSVGQSTGDAAKPPSEAPPKPQDTWINKDHEIPNLTRLYENGPNDSK